MNCGVDNRIRNRKLRMNLRRARNENTPKMMLRKKQIPKRYFTYNYIVDP